MGDILINMGFVAQLFFYSHEFLLLIQLPPIDFPVSHFVSRDIQVTFRPSGKLVTNEAPESRRRFQAYQVFSLENSRTYSASQADPRPLDTPPVSDSVTRHRDFVFNKKCYSRDQQQKTADQVRSRTAADHLFTKKYLL